MPQYFFREKRYYSPWYGDHNEEHPEKAAPERVANHNDPRQPHRLEDSCYERRERRRRKRKE